MTRDDFRESVFLRDNHKCVICGKPAKDAHHILERRLFDNGGYDIDNGVSLCEDHHIGAEQTILSCNELREKAGIKKIVLPDHFYSDCDYDKWGNIILPNGQRLKGELFFDEPVQKILKSGCVLDLFQKYIKYPRTYHLPWSTLLKDDRMLKDDSNFMGKRVITTLKMDGENTTMYGDHIHARSIESPSHESRTWVKTLWSQKNYLLENLRICGENLYAVHTIKYENLKSYFMVFSVWDNDNNICFSWDDTNEYAELLELDIVPVIYDGIYDREKIMGAFKKHEKEHEGYVVRIADSFKYQDFKKCVAKFVQPKFRDKVNNSHGHWILKKVEKNKLNKED